MGERLLEVNGPLDPLLHPRRRGQGGQRRQLHARPRETLGIVGESGSGKTVAALSLMRLIPDPPGKVVEGSLMLGDRDLRTHQRRRDARKCAATTSR